VLAYSAAMGHLPFHLGFRECDSYEQDSLAVYANEKGGRRAKFVLAVNNCYGALPRIGKNWQQ
jgi:hypothetical protein